jgi:hypothetical protein
MATACQSEDIELPQCLLGSTEETRRRWSSIAASAWEEASWARIVRELEFVPSRQTVGPIVVWNYDRLVETTNEAASWRTTEDVWQFNWILECMPASYDELLAEHERHLRLVLEGMQHPWFCLGMLEGDPRFLPFLYQRYHVHRPSEHVRATVIRPILKRFLGHLPRLLHLDGRIAVASGRTGVEFVGIGARLPMFVDLLCYGGYVDPKDAFGVVEKPPQAMTKWVLDVYGRCLTDS